MCKNLFFIKTIYQAPDDAIVPRQLGDDDLSHLYSIRITSFPERCFFQGQNSLCGSTRTIHLKGLPYACVGTYYNWHRLWECQPCCATQAPNPRGYDEATIPRRLGNDGLNCLYSTRVTFLPKKRFFKDKTHYVTLVRLTMCECGLTSSLTSSMRMLAMLRYPSS